MSPRLQIKIKNKVRGDGAESVRALPLRDEWIKLGQALKASGLSDTGVDAKYAILDGKVKVNGEVETRRGRKLYSGDRVTFGPHTILIQ